MPPAVTAAARRAKRVIESATPESSEPEEHDDDGEGDEDDEDAGDDDGEDEVEEEVEMEIDDEVEDEEGAGGDEGEDGDGDGDGDGDDDDEDEAEEDDDLDDDDDESAAPSPSGLKIKLRVAADEGRGKRAAAQKAAKKTKRTAREAELGSDQDEVYDEDDSRAPSPSKMTARQRAKQNKDLQDTLISLPDGQPKVKPVLTEAERLQKREEMARRRKRQNEQRLQDEQDQTINRLLRAQTGRSRSKLDGPSPMPDANGEDSGAAPSGATSPTKRSAPPPDGVRYVSALRGDDVVLSVSVRAGREGWLDVGGGGGGERAEGRDARGLCAAKGCAQPRKYRCVGRFETGGCSLAHLKEVEAALK
ncbi:hypothetical protein Q8F55_007943 [Vanrija albida]|uniref:INO80 complex subunit B-like conserved region domain-containing protein n=1 Tax=Vanrija albida TaxID=181172 RepID=A0ABR3PUZ9_9TREE